MANTTKATKARVSDVIRAIEGFAPASLAYGWDKMGLATGAPDDVVTRALTALTVTQATLKAAKRVKADMIVAHHPLIWDPLTTLRTDAAPAKLCLDIATAGIACYSAHTNLDVARGGVNDILFNRLGLTNRKPLFPVAHARMVKLVAFVPDSHLVPVRDAVCSVGAGLIGNYTHCSYSSPGTGTFKPNEAANPFAGARGVLNEEPERRFEVLVSHERLGDALAALRASHPYEEPAFDVFPLDAPHSDASLGLIGTLESSAKLDDFAEHVRAALDIHHVRVTGKSSAKVRTVAVMGGAGGGSTPDVPGGVDVFVTGDVKYHETLDAQERGLNVIDAGHHGTEKWIVPWLARFLKQEVPGVKTSAYMEPDPFRLVTGS